MNLTRHPELLDRLAAAHALGTLRGGARRRFETLAREQAPVRAAALIWQSRLASFNELQPEIAPADTVWTRIDHLVRGDTRHPATAAPRKGTAQPTGGWLDHVWLWRGACAAGVLATATALVTGVNLRNALNQEIRALQARLEAAPRIGYVAVLTDAQATASMLATFDITHQRLDLQRVSGYRETTDRSLQLWALPSSGRPKSLGVLGEGPILQLTASEGDVSDALALAISLEPKGGVSGERGPTGPVLFKGPLIRHHAT